MTGSPVPTAADAIVPFEDTVGGLADSLGADHRRARSASASARTSAAAARTPSSATSCCPPGTVLGALQARRRRGGRGRRGRRHADAARRRRLDRAPSSSPPGSPLRRGQIPESNSELLAGLAAEAGAEVVLRATRARRRRRPAARDRRGRGARRRRRGLLRRRERRRVRGGQEHARRHAWSSPRCAMQPGKPQGFGVHGRRDAAVRPARQPGERRGLVRGVRPPRAAARCRAAPTLAPPGHPPRRGGRLAHAARPHASTSPSRSTAPTPRAWRAVPATRRRIAPRGRARPRRGLRGRPRRGRRGRRRATSSMSC